MDWRSVAFDWNHARAFLVTAEEGSLSAAARALGVSQPTLGRQVEALQQALGVVLFERVGRGLTLTPGGHDLLDHVRAMGEDARRFSLAASGRSQVLEGAISITASEVEAAYVLPPIIERLRREAPAITVELVVSNQRVDLLLREADIAIRNFSSEQPDIIQRRLRDERAWLYAAPSLIKQLGEPLTVDALSRADFVGFNRTDVMIEGLAAIGLKLTQDNFPIITENLFAQWELVKRGLVIGVMSEVVGDGEPMVRRVDPGIQPLVFPVWLATHREVGMSRRVRFVFDLLAEELTKD